MTYVRHQDCFDFIKTLDDGSVRLVATDPPYFGIVKDHWDNQWKTPSEYVDWLYSVFAAVKPKMTPDGSLVFFGGIGKHGQRPFFEILSKIESTNLFTYRNLITWAKRRAYGKSHDYLFTREEIAWYSVSAERTEVVFNIPLLDEKRGYAGFNPKYPAKSEYKRVTNVWTDIPELMRPKRNTQKPVKLMERIVSTHSNKGDLVVDMFCGSGTTGEAAIGLERRFLGCEAILEDAASADAACVARASGHGAMMNMNPLGQLRYLVEKKHPEERFFLVPPMRENGIWSLDVVGNGLSIEWSIEKPSVFGISSFDPDAYGEFPDEIHTSLEAATARVLELLSTGGRTVRSRGGV